MRRAYQLDACPTECPVEPKPPRDVEEEPLLLERGPVPTVLVRVAEGRDEAGQIVRVPEERLDEELQCQPRDRRLRHGCGCATPGATPATPVPGLGAARPGAAPLGAPGAAAP
jgi:hypothetical protein